MTFVLLASAFFLTPTPTHAAYGTQEAPKLINFWLGWELTDQNVRELAKWDVVVLDMDQQSRNADNIRQLKRLNPNIKILAYISSGSIAAARFVQEPDTVGYKLAHSLPEGWFMHRGNERVSHWSGAWLMNISEDAPRDSAGRRWLDFLPQFIEREMMTSGLWSGVFLDDALIGPTWFVGGGLDMNGDGRADDDAAVNASWQRGWVRMAAEARRRLGSDAVLMGNGAIDYAPYVNGILFENFPRYGWVRGFREYQTSYHYNQKPSVTAINSNANNVNNPADYRAMRLGLGSSMLANGYYSFDYGDKNHGQTWWYDEYDAALGAPTGPPTLIDPAGQSGILEGVWWREYEHGAVVVNSSAEAKRVPLPSVYERLRGTQDASVNNGALETSVTIPARDALLLYRRVETATLSASTAYVNGSFVRVYDESGRQARSGFFAQRTGVAGGAIVLTGDVDRDGTLDVLTAHNGEIGISFGSGGSRTLRPFGAGFRGALYISVANMDRDDAWEIAVGRGGSAQVRVVELDGTVRATWDAYVPWFQGGVEVAVGNLDGDDKREIVTGAGPTGGPHIRIFKTDGELWSGGFFAFDKRERGGVSVAVGDVNADGKDEIIAGSGQGSVPRVRIFTYAGTLLREFTLGTAASARGVHVSVSDVNGDGQPEILASGIDPSS